LPESNSAVVVNRPLLYVQVIRHAHMLFDCLLCTSCR
jgi:hypothetical protein